MKNQTILRLCVAVGCSLLMSCLASGEHGVPVSSPASNLDFESPSTDSTSITGWFTPTNFHGYYNASVQKAHAYQGKQCAQIVCLKDPKELNEFGNVMQSIPAASYAGKTVRFRAAVRVVPGSKGHAQLWMRADLRGGGMGFFDNMDDRPIELYDWQYYEIVGLIDSNAAVLNYGCMLIGAGAIEFDDVSITVVPTDPNQSLTPKPLANLNFETANTDSSRIPGWFSPTQDVGEYTAGVHKAQTVQGERCAFIRSLPAVTGNSFGNIMRMMPATPYAGKTVRFRAAVRLMPNSKGTAHLWMRVDLKDRQTGFFDNMDNRPVTSTEWKYYEVVGKIEPNADRLNIGCFLTGSGELEFDDASLEIIPTTAP